MIEIEIELVGPMRRPWPERSRALEVEEGTTVAGLLAKLGYSDDEARHLAVRVNGSKASWSSTLSESDCVVILLIVGGG